jgi:hypothetical protein
MRSSLALAGLALAGCVAGPSFEIGALRPTTEGAQIVLVGWAQFADAFRLYPIQADLGKTGDRRCISGLLTSLAGIPPPVLDGQRLRASGQLYRVGNPEVASVRDQCGSGLVLLVDDIGLP